MVHSQQARLLQRSDSSLWRAEERSFGRGALLDWRRVRCVWVRGRRLGAAVGARTAPGAPAAAAVAAAVQRLRRTAEVRLVFHAVRQQRVNAKVLRFLHGAGHCARQELRKVCMLYRGKKPLLLNILLY